MTGSIIPLSPTPEVSPTPTGIGEIVIAGQAMSRTVFIILLIGIAAVLTIVAIYIWDWRKKKGAFSGEDTSASDDEEI
ncbi:MAG: hypothetical protein HW405_272 [Candidatus Berkelbacteria bacterium]|nr:hypothetical protein [Candidatus Berkelbacteria bacterium]